MNPIYICGNFSAPNARSPTYRHRFPVKTGTDKTGNIKTTPTTQTLILTLTLTLHQLIALYRTLIPNLILNFIS